MKKDFLLPIYHEDSWYLFTYNLETASATIYQNKYERFQLIKQHYLGIKNISVSCIDSTDNKPNILIFDHDISSVKIYSIPQILHALDSVPLITFNVTSKFTHVLSGNFSKQAAHDLLFYNTHDGHVALYTANSRGFTLTAEHSIQPHWDTLFSGRFGSIEETDIFFLNSVSRVAIIQKLSLQYGSISTTPLSLEFSDFNPKQVLPGRFSTLRKNTDLLFYEKEPQASEQGQITLNSFNSGELRALTAMNLADNNLQVLTSCYSFHPTQLSYVFLYHKQTDVIESYLPIVSGKKVTRIELEKDFRASFQDTPPTPEEVLQDTLSTCIDAGYALYDNKRYNEALSALQQSRPILDKLLAIYPTDYLLLQQKAKILTDIGAIYLALGTPKLALEFFDLALKISPHFRLARGGRQKALHELSVEIPTTLNENNIVSSGDATNTPRQSSLSETNINPSPQANITDIEKIWPDPSLHVVISRQLKELINKLSWDFRHFSDVIQCFFRHSPYHSTAVGEQFLLSLQLIIDYQIRWSAKDNEEHCKKIINIFATAAPNEWEIKIQPIILLIASGPELPEKDLATLLKEFKDLNAFSAEKITTLQSLYESMMSRFASTSKIVHSSETISNWNINHIEDWSSKIKNNRALANDHNNFPELLAVIRQACKLNFGYYPRAVQILAVILMTLDGTSQLAEIATSEGKSNIIAMLAIFVALQEQQADVVTSSYVLAKRDALAMKSFFALFGLSVADNGPSENKCCENGPRECYKQNIVYGDAFHYEGDILRDEYELEGTRAKRGFSTAIVDEADNPLIDYCTHIVRLVRTKPGLEYLNYILAAIWQRLAITEKRLIEHNGHTFFVTEENSVINNDQESHCSLVKIDDKKSFVTQELLHFVKKAIQEEKIGDDDFIVPKHLKAFCLKLLPRWIENAYMAKHYYHENQQYIIKENSEGVRSITPVDYDNTGVVQNRMTWSDGLHQFLEMKHELTLTSMSINTNYISNLSYFRRYKRLCAMTGTIGSTASQQLLKDIYKLAVCFVPTFKPTRFFQHPGIVVTSVDEQRQLIVARTLQAARLKRAVLMICRTIEESKILQQLLIIKNLSYLTTKLYTRDDTSEKDIIEETANPGDVIIATNLGGRGVHISLNPEVKLHGGLLVIVTSIFIDRVTIQALRRAARNGDPGSGIQIVVYRHQVPFEYLKQVMEEIEDARLKELRNEIMKIELQDELFQSFCEILQPLRRQKISPYIIQAIEERWGLWLAMQNKQLAKDYSFQTQQKLQSRFRRLQNALKTDKAHHQLIENPHFFILEGNRFARQGNWDQAEKFYYRAKRFDKNFSANAYFYRAFVWGSKENKVKFEKYLRKALERVERVEVPPLLAMFTLLNTKPVTKEDTSDLNQHLIHRLQILDWQKKVIDTTSTKVKELGGLDEVELSLKDLRSYYENQKPPLELDSFYWHGLEDFIEVKKKPSFWGCLVVGLLGVIQIAGGILLTTFTAGLGAQIGAALVKEGINDIYYAVQSAISGNFNWSEWAEKKALSLAVSLGSPAISSFANKLLSSDTLAVVNVVAKNGKIVHAVSKGDLGALVPELVNGVSGLANAGKLPLTPEQLNSIKDYTTAGIKIVEGDYMGAANVLDRQLGVVEKIKIKEHMEHVTSTFKQTYEQVVPIEARNFFDTVIKNRSFEKLDRQFQDYAANYLQSEISTRFEESGAQTMMGEILRLGGNAANINQAAQDAFNKISPMFDGLSQTVLKSVMANRGLPPSHQLYSSVTSKFDAAFRKELSQLQNKLQSTIANDDSLPAKEIVVDTRKFCEGLSQSLTSSFTDEINKRLSKVPDAYPLQQLATGVSQFAASTLPAIPSHYELDPSMLSPSIATNAVAGSRSPASIPVLSDLREIFQSPASQKFVIFTSDLAAMAVNTYDRMHDPVQAGNQIREDFKTFALDVSWKKMKPSYLRVTKEQFSFFNDDGCYKIDYYVNDRYKLICFAYRGTGDYLSNFLIDDFQAAVKMTPRFYEFAANTTAMIRNNYLGYTFIHTGHSLGGAIAMLIAATHGEFAKVFDAFGVREIVEGNLELRAKIKPNYQITVYNSTPNIVNFLGSHLDNVRVKIITHIESVQLESQRLQKLVQEQTGINVLTALQTKAVTVLSTPAFKNYTLHSHKMSHIAEGIITTSISHYTAKRGDTLSGIAQNRYSIANEWRRLYHLNMSHIANPDVIYEGQELQIANLSPRAHQI